MCIDYSHQSVQLFLTPKSWTENLTFPETSERKKKKLLKVLQFCVPKLAWEFMHAQLSVCKTGDFFLHFCCCCLVSAPGVLSFERSHSLVAANKKLGAAGVEFFLSLGC